MILRPAAEIYRDCQNDRKLYVCHNYPACNTYVAAHPGTNQPMGVPANGDLRNLRIQAHRKFDRIWQTGIMTRKAFPAKQETKPLTETPQEADDDTRLSLLRQVNYRIMEQLKQSYPTVAWLWEARPSSEEISKGCTKRIKLYHCDPFNFGEVTLSATGKLEIALVQMVPLAEAELQPHNDEDLEEQDILDRSDVKQWYTQKGIALLSALIDELNVQGHKRLTIKENGDVFVTASGKQQPVDTIPDFPPRPAWEDLCVLAREDDIAAEVCNQELTVSWA